MIKIKDSGRREVFSTGAVRDASGSMKGAFHLVPFDIEMELAIHYEAGAEKYLPRNWEKGIPLHKYYDSNRRHSAKAFWGWDDESHEMAAAWNIFGFRWTYKRIVEGKLPMSLANKHRCPKSLIMRIKKDRAAWKKGKLIFCENIV